MTNPHSDRCCHAGLSHSVYLRHVHVSNYYPNDRLLPLWLRQKGCWLERGNLTCHSRLREPSIRASWILPRPQSFSPMPPLLGALYSLKMSHHALNGHFLGDSFQTDWDGTGCTHDLACLRHMTIDLASPQSRDSARSFIAGERCHLTGLLFRRSVVRFEGFQRY